MDMMGNCFDTYHYVLYVSYITLIVLAKINNCIDLKWTWPYGYVSYAKKISHGFLSAICDIKMK